MNRPICITLLSVDVQAALIDNVRHICHSDESYEGLKMMQFLWWFSVAFLIVGLVFIVLGFVRFRDEEKSLKRFFLGGLSFFAAPVIISIVSVFFLSSPFELFLISSVIGLILMVPLLVGSFVVRSGYPMTSLLNRLFSAFE